jgi:hypothetical protein
MQERTAFTVPKRAFLEALLATWPSEFGYRLDNDVVEHVQRLLDLRIVERRVNRRLRGAFYSLTSEYLAGLGATPWPEFN